MNPQIIESRYGYLVAYEDDRYLGEAVISYGEYGNEEADFLLSLLPKDTHIVEVGSNAGYLTIPLASRYHVVAIEPQPSCYGLLVANTFLNQLYERVLCVNAACGEKSGFCYVPTIDYQFPGNHGGIEVQSEAKGMFQTMVQVKTLDELIGSPIGLIKADVEGMEIDVLKGAKETIKKYQPFLYVENDRLEKSQELIEYIWSIGYDCMYHTPALFNPDNYFKKSENLWPRVGSVNMIAAPKARQILEKPIMKSTDRPGDNL
jgi:FkbM family methyltransferase